MSTQQIPIASIEIDNRMRIDQGSLDSLCESMHERGLLQGIGVQPVDGTKFRLLWGGRRLTAAIRLGWENIEAKVADGLEDYEASELEFMENWERKSMTWTEEAKGLYRIHSQRVRKGALIGESWGQRETGRLLGISLGNVNYTITIAKLLEAGDSEIDSCPNMAEAMRVLLRRKEAEAMQGGKPTPRAPGETFFKQSDLDRFNEPQAPKVPGPVPGPAPESVYRLRRVIDPEKFNISGAGIIGRAWREQWNMAWILDRNGENRVPEERLIRLQGGLVFRDLSVRDGYPFLPALVPFQFYFDPEAKFLGDKIPPYYADTTTLEKILYGPDALSDGFWRWFFHDVVKGSFSCVYFHRPLSIEAVEFCLRNNYMTYATVTDEQVLAIEKEAKKYGQFECIDTGL